MITQFNLLHVMTFFMYEYCLTCFTTDKPYQLCVQKTFTRMSTYETRLTSSQRESAGHEIKHIELDTSGKPTNVTNTGKY